MVGDLKMPQGSQITASDVEEYRKRALKLIENQKTLVLATSAGDKVWAAPVYYVYIAPSFYFFSSPRSRHILNALENPCTAATVFSDSSEWKLIEGLQMNGEISTVKQPVTQIKVSARYLKKFPFAKSLMAEKAKGGLDLGTKVRLYAFAPQQIYLTSNLMGFGQRLAIDLQNG